MRLERFAGYTPEEDFNSRTHVECDIGVWTKTLSLAKFQLTHSRGVRLWMSDRKKKRGGFQLTHSRGVRQPLPVVPTTENNFNSRTHVECDPTVLLAPSRSNHFNSRTHVECDLNATSVNLDDIISTHALTWSATPLGYYMCWRKRISTHALTWSATCTHTAKTATKRFQLTHSRGVRHFGYNPKCFRIGFQLTHSRGVRRKQRRSVRYIVHFNSRTHVECDGWRC